MDSIVRIPSVTGIDVELKIAGPGARSYAFIIDWHIRFVVAAAWVFIGLFLAGGATVLFDPVGDGDFAGLAFMLFALLPSVLVYFLYHPVLEVLMRGQTPGKRIAGVRLVSLADGGTPGIGALLIRNVFRLIDSLPFAYAIGLATTMLTKHATRIGDLAAGTVLVYDESHGREALEEISGAAVQRLGLEQAQLARELLSRWRELGPESRSRLARQLLAKHNVPADSTADADLERTLRELLA